MKLSLHWCALLVGLICVAGCGEERLSSGTQATAATTAAQQPADAQTHRAGPSLSDDLEQCPAATGASDLMAAAEDHHDAVETPTQMDSGCPVVDAFLQEQF